MLKSTFEEKKCTFLKNGFKINLIDFRENVENCSLISFRAFEIVIFLRVSQVFMFASEIVRQ